MSLLLKNQDLTDVNPQRMYLHGDKMETRTNYGILKHVVPAGSSMLLAKGYVYKVYRIKKTASQCVSQLARQSQNYQ
jgi:hypothetical protein